MSDLKLKQWTKAELSALPVGTKLTDGMVEYERVHPKGDKRPQWHCECEFESGPARACEIADGPPLACMSIEDWEDQDDE